MPFLGRINPPLTADRRMPEPLLNQFSRKPKAAVRRPVDAPRRIEMAERMQAGIFRRAIGFCDTGRDLHRMPSVKHDVAVGPYMPVARNEHDIGA